MIHLICAENRHLYEDVLAQMHQARAEYFVKRRGWINLSVQDGLEYDEYDNESTVYLVGFDDDRSIAVSTRLVPADNGCLLADKFPHLVSEGPVKGPGVYELSRYFVSRRRRGPAGFAIRSQLNVATLEAVLERGATRVVSCTDLYIMSTLRFTGWRVRPIGLPAAYDEGTAAAFEIGCRQGDLGRIRRILRLAGRQLFQAPAWLPRGSNVLAIAEAIGLILNAPSPVSEPVIRAIEDAATRWTPQGDVGASFHQRAAA
jgi:acyl-homoserine lactone synthase